MIYEYNGTGCLLEDGLYYFYASWSSKCNTLKERLQRLSSSMPDLRIYRVNTTHYQTLKKNLSIQRIPTYLCVNDAHIVSKMEGNVDFYSLKKWIEKMRE